MPGTGNDLIVDVGKVAHIGNLKTLETQQADHDVKNNHGPGMTDMTTVINGDPADIDAHLRRIQRVKRFFLFGLRIIYFQGHDSNDPFQKPILDS